MDDVTKIASSEVLHRLDTQWLNHQAIANNLANINTPGFQATHVVPEELPPLLKDLREVSLSQTNERHLGKQSLTPVPGTVAVPVENLSVDSEMAEMAKNNLFYQTLLDSVQRRDRMSRSVIQGR